MKFSTTLAALGAIASVNALPSGEHSHGAAPPSYDSYGISDDAAPAAHSHAGASALGPKLSSLPSISSFRWPPIKAPKDSGLDKPLQGPSSPAALAGLSTPKGLSGFASLSGPSSKLVATPLAPNASAAQPAALLGAAGVGVKSLNASIAFYTNVLNIGLKPGQALDFPTWKEVILSFPKSAERPSGGAAVVLMQYAKGAPPAGQQGKLVFYVPDVKAIVDRIKAQGGVPALDLGAGEGPTKAIAIVRDIDGNLIELLPFALASAFSGAA